MRGQIKSIFLLAIILVGNLVNCHENLLFLQDVHDLTEEIIETSITKSHKGTSSDIKLSAAVPDYDMYVLTIQWGNTLCLQSNYCKNKIKTLTKNIFTLHGLWPSLKTGKLLPDCNTGKAIPVKIQDKNLESSMKLYWTSYTGGDVQFWEHEYNKHGYCYTNKSHTEGYEPFFRTALNLYIDYKLDSLISDVISSSKGDKISITGDNLRNIINQKYSNLKFDLDCVKISGVSYLKEVRFYLSFDMQPITPYKKSDCPNSQPIIIPKYIE